MAKKRRPCHQDAAFVIPSKSAALALPHEHRNLRPFDDACAWIKQEGNTARRRVVLHGFMASSIQVACAPKTAALLETIPRIPSRQHEGIEALESYASECLTTYNLYCSIAHSGVSGHLMASVWRFVDSSKLIETASVPEIPAVLEARPSVRVKRGTREGHLRKRRSQMKSVTVPFAGDWSS